MKKILLVTRPIAPPWDEASKNFAFYLAKTLSMFDFFLLTNGYLPNLPYHIHQRPIYTSNKLGLSQKIKLLKIIRMPDKFDIIHFMLTPNKLNAFSFKTFLSMKHAKTIQTIATLREDLFKDEEFKDILFADALITYSDYAKNKLESLKFKNVFRIYPGIDIDLYKKQRKNPDYMKTYGFSESDFIINFTGEYTRLEAMDDVVASFIEISKSIPNAKLSMAVRIKNAQDAEKKKEVVEIFKKNGLLKRVAFHDDGFYEMTDIYNLCDISIFPVRNMRGKFDVPLAVIEAMACEKPVIISGLPILEEFAKEENSVRIEKGNVKQLNAAIIDLYNNPEKRESIGKNARKYVEENFDINSVADQYEKVYNKLA